LRSSSSPILRQYAAKPFMFIRRNFLDSDHQAYFRFSLMLPADLDPKA
jgi:hypothetical protein